MFKMIFILLFVLLVEVSARPQDGLASTLNFQDNVYDPNTGTYNYNFETSNGIRKEETGNLLYPEMEDSELEVRGSYSYTSPDGNLITVIYTADKNGFRPQLMLIPDQISSQHPITTFSDDSKEDNLKVKTFISSAAIATLGGGGLG